METALVEVLKGVPVAAVLFYFAVQFRKDSQASQEKYEMLVNKTFDYLNKWNQETAAGLSRSTQVMERLERKMDEKP